MKLFSVFVLIALIVVLVLTPGKQKSRPFSLEAIASHLPYHPEWECRKLNSEEESEIAGALSQPYRFLGNGGQCYTFASEDDRYVIKFFKQKAFAIPEWIERFPVPFLVGFLHEKKTRKKHEQRNRVFEAFKLSLDQLGDETEILYVHVNPTSHLDKILVVKDVSGSLHQLDLDPLEFVVQRKAELAHVRIHALMQNKDTEGAKRAIDKLLDLNLALYQKGFYNRDPNFRSNCGFIGPKAILIDVGRVVYKEDLKKPKVFKRAVLKSTQRFRNYLTSNYPELVPYFDNCVAKILPANNNEKHEIAL